MSSRLMSRQSDAPSSSAYSTERHSPTVTPDNPGTESKVISSRSVSYGCASDFICNGPVHSPSLSRCGCEWLTLGPTAVPQPHQSQIRNPALLRPSEIAISLPRSPARVVTLPPFARGHAYSSSSTPRDSRYVAPCQLRCGATMPGVRTVRDATKPNSGVQ